MDPKDEPQLNNPSGNNIAEDNPPQQPPSNYSSPQQYPPQQYHPQQYPPQKYPLQQYPPHEHPLQQRGYYPSPNYPQYRENAPLLLQSGFVPRDSFDMLCPHCAVNVRTETRYKSGLATYLICGCFCAMGCWFGCCFIPFCVNDLKDVNHYCPRCDRAIAKNRIL